MANDQPPTGKSVCCMMKHGCRNSYPCHPITNNRKPGHPAAPLSNSPCANSIKPFKPLVLAISMKSVFADVHCADITLGPMLLSFESLRPHLEIALQESSLVRFLNEPELRRCSPLIKETAHWDEGSRPTKKPELAKPDLNSCS